MIARRSAAVLLLLGVLAGGCSTARPAEPPAPPAEAQPQPEPAPTPAPAPEPPPPPPPPKPPEAVIRPTTVLQGDFAVLQLDKPVEGAVKVVVDGLSEQPKVYLQDGLPTAILGFPAAARVGAYPVAVTWDGGEWKGSVEVVWKKFTEDRLIVTEQQEAVRYDPRSPAEWERIYALRSTSLDRPLWAGPFQVPLQGDLKITTYFGEIRYVNGKESGRHSGMDFGAPTGTPIYAPARGKVILAEPIILTGNTVIIDHGYNLFTAYYHCETLEVEPGQVVKAGQQIATVGSTGFSTGPHLHWTATIGNTPVDPWPLTQSAPLGIYPPPPRGFQQDPS